MGEQGDKGQDKGVAASPPGHSAEPEPVPVSAASAASTPNAGQWAVVCSNGYYQAVRIDNVTPKLIKCRAYGRRYHQYARDCIEALFDTQGPADELIQAIDGVRGSFREPRFKERKRHQEAMDSLNVKQEAATQRVIAKMLAKARGQ